MSEDSGDEVAVGDFADQFVTGTNIEARRLVGTVVGSIVVAVTAGYIQLIETMAQLNVRAIEGVLGFLQELVETTVGGSAAVVVEGWRIGAVAALESGVLAPWIITLEALVVVAVVTTLWDGRPYG